MDSHRFFALAVAISLGATLAPLARAQQATGRVAQAAAPAPPPPPGPPPPPPVGAAPSPSAPAAPLARGRVSSQAETTLRFEPTAPDVSLLGHSGYTLQLEETRRFRRIRYYEWAPQELFAPICDGPCEARVVPGEYRLALSRTGSDAAVPAGRVTIAGPSLLRGELVDRSGQRTAGAVIGLGGVITGVVLIAASVASNPMNDAMFGAGIGTVVVSAVVGAILGLRRDEAHVSVSPLTF